MMVTTIQWLLVLGLGGTLALTEPNFVSSPDAQYDYIIVGGGTAGTALAARLSQSLPSTSILVVEAGPAQLDNAKINVPGLKGSTLATPLDWNFTTVAQTGANGRVMPVNRGRVLGGSSALNLMCWDRASAAEYDAWEQLGNTGWNWDTMLPAMLKVENFTRNGTDYGENGVGDEGPIRSVINRVVPDSQQYWIPTLQNLLGLSENLESLGGDPLGASYQPSNIDATHYNRSYAPNAYLALAGDNLHILTNSVVSKVVFDNNNSTSLRRRSCSQKNLTATGIALQDGTIIQASREVILSAGSIQSPALLELSGIGQSSVLSAAGITQLMNLPGVGENYQDHLRFQVSQILKDGLPSFDVLKYNSTYAAEQMALWEQGQVSLYDYTASGFAFMNWDQAGGNATASRMLELGKQAVGNSSSVAARARLAHLSDTSVPQIEIIFSDGYTGFKGYPSSSNALYGRNMFTLLGAIQQPLSRGSIHINTTSPSITNFIIDPNYLSNAHDVAAAVNLVKLLRQIAQAAPLSDIIDAEYEPGSAVQTDAEWEAYVRSSVLSIYHPVGTCAMLPEKDGGVVDPRLKVWGTTNLRVVDASIMPVLLSAHIQTAVYGIAEKAAEMIVEDASA